MYKFDKTRLDLAAEFRANPFGTHSPDLQYLLNFMRQPSLEPFHVLFVERPGECWRLAIMTPCAQKAPQLTEVSFDNLGAAEWYVFRLRWAKLAGNEELPPG